MGVGCFGCNQNNVVENTNEKVVPKSICFQIAFPELISRLTESVTRASHTSLACYVGKNFNHESYSNECLLYAMRKISPIVGCSHTRCGANVAPLLWGLSRRGGPSKRGAGSAGSIFCRQAEQLSWNFLRSLSKSGTSVACKRATFLFFEDLQSYFLEAIWSILNQGVVLTKNSAKGLM